MRALRSLSAATGIVMVLSGAAAAPALLGQSRLPGSGDAVVVRGCLRGSTLEATEIGLADEDERQPSAHRFQIKGKKDLLKTLRERHDGSLVEITGTLKSRLTEASERGAKVGSTRIVVGAESSMRGGSMPPPAQALPVLEAKSVEGTSISCRR